MIRNYILHGLRNLTSILINESAAKLSGWEQPVGEAFLSSYGRLAWKVEGIVKDFHNRSLHHEVGFAKYWARQ